MTVPTLRLALPERPHTLALASIATDGYALDVEFGSFEEVRHGFINEGRWDATEFPLGRYIALKAAGDASLIAIPVYPWRSFRHAAIHVRNDGSITSPADLEGRRVGVSDWHQTAGIVARGLLAREYGVRLERIEWVVAGVDGPPRVDTFPVPAPRGVALARSPVSLAELLRQGEIDAIIAADAPRDGGTRPLIANLEQEEEAWFARTGIFPLMHVIAIRRSALGKIPSLDELQRVFELAKASSRPALDAKWRYGLKENEAALGRLLDDAFAQGIGERRLTPQDLFASDAHVDIA
ncbi:hypothetical protein [Ancylobacter terrae]|uniref:hypothetical protein n=1 Tax=Ancylobacter sp. sgz301288 TaxID=3342077 RepID=UPI00385E6BFF